MNADILDNASDIEEAERDRRIGEIRRQADRDALLANVPLPDECLNCGEKPRERSRFCDSDCRSDFDRRKLLERRAGMRK